MMKKIEDLNYYELLEVSPSASAQDIHRAYERVRRIYEPNSIALYSLFTSDETAAIHRRIEEAYRTLIYEDNRRKYDAQLREVSELPDLPPPPPPRAFEPAAARTALPPLPEAKPFIPEPEPQPLPEPAPPIPEKQQPEDIAAVAQFIGEFTGPAIKALRDQLGISQRAVANKTKIGLRYLDYIEAEEYAKLPARPYLRGFIMLYAKALGCDAERMAGDYMKRYDAVMAPKTK